MLLHVIGTDGDRNGCAPPVHGVQEPPDAGPWIALVRRGKCSFQTKVDNARRAGASAVIVYNDREATDLDKMKLLPSDPSEYDFFILTIRCRLIYKQLKQYDGHSFIF